MTRDEPVTLEEIVPEDEETAVPDMAAELVIDLRAEALCTIDAVTVFETVDENDTSAETESAPLKLLVDEEDWVGKLNTAVGDTVVSKLMLAHPVALIVINAVADFVNIDERVTEKDGNAEGVAELVGV